MYTFLYGFYVFFLGASIGSFINVLSDRLPSNHSIMGRSRCDHCRHMLAWYDLIPVISFFALRARCQYCKKPIGSLYVFIEIVTGLLFVFVGWWGLFIEKYHPGIIVVLWLIISALMVIILSDAKYQIIPDQMQILLGIFILVFQFMIGLGIGDLWGLVRDGMLVTTPILLLYLVTNGKGMGFGDVKLSFLIGLLLGVKAGFIAVYIAFIVGAVFGVATLVMKKKSLHSKIAFGPFLVFGMMIMLFFGHNIVNQIIAVYGL